MQDMQRKSELNFVHVKFDIPIIFTLEVSREQFGI